MGNLVKYGSFTVEDAEDTEKELARGGSMMTLQVGDNVVRVLPPLEGRKLMTVTWQHYVEIPGLDNALIFNCPRNMVKKPCPVCDAADRLFSTGNPADRGKANDLFPKKRVYINVIDRACPEDGPKVMAVPKQVADQLTALRKNEKAGGDFTDPLEGFDLTINKPKSFKGGQKYSVQPDRTDSPLAPDHTTINDWIENQPSHTRYASVDSPELIREKCEKAMTFLSPSGPPAHAPSSRSLSGKTAKPAKARTAADDAMEPPGWMEGDTVETVED